MTKSQFNITNDIVNDSFAHKPDDLLVICSERWVNSHKKYHAGLCPFMCTECGCAFNAPYRLVSHHRKFHPGLFVYTCEKCMMVGKDISD